MFNINSDFNTVMESEYELELSKHIYSKRRQFVRYFHHWGLCWSQILAPYMCFATDEDACVLNTSLIVLLCYMFAQ